MCGFYVESEIHAVPSDTNLILINCTIFEFKQKMWLTNFDTFSMQGYALKFILNLLSLVYLLYRLY